MVKRGENTINSISKRGQITIFLIFGIGILVLSMVLFFLNQDFISNADVDMDKVRGFVEHCIETEAKEVIFEIGRGGGYYFPGDYSTESGIAIYQENGVINIPETDKIEEEISSILNKKLFFCTKSFVDFPELEVRQGDISSKVLISEEKISVNIIYPLSLKKGEKVYLLKDFKTEIDDRLGELLKSAKEFINNNIEGKICLSCLFDIAMKYDFFVDMFDYNDEIKVFVFKDSENKEDEESFQLIFSIKNKGERQDV